MPHSSPSGHNLETNNMRQSACAKTPQNRPSTLAGVCVKSRERGFSPM